MAPTIVTSLFATMPVVYASCRAITRKAINRSMVFWLPGMPTVSVVLCLPYVPANRKKGAHLHMLAHYSTTQKVQDSSMQFVSFDPHFQQRRDSSLLSTIWNSILLPSSTQYQLRKLCTITNTSKFIVSINTCGLINSFCYRPVSTSLLIMVHIRWYHTTSEDQKRPQIGAHDW